MNKDILLVGSGGMAVDYAKVLRALGVNYLVIGRGESSAKSFRDATGKDVILGGLSRYLSKKLSVPTHAIVAVGVENLHETTILLLEYGVKNILVEKPVGMNKQAIEEIYQKTKENNALVSVGYNRRFYASVLKAQEIIADDGGVTSFNFEFTEWAHIIEPLKKAPGIKEKWFLSNSIHVVDLAFYLGGRPKEICTFTAGGLDWHPAASIFSGAGLSEGGALFSYQANWESAGRWSVEILTRQHRLILRPMEKLQIQKKGSIVMDFAECDYTLDESFKPGLFIQTRNFINNITDGMCMIEDHVAMIDSYYKVAAYK